MVLIEFCLSQRYLRPNLFRAESGRPYRGPSSNPSHTISPFSYLKHITPISWSSKTCTQMTLNWAKIMLLVFSNQRLFPKRKYHTFIPLGNLLIETADAAGVILLLWHKQALLLFSVEFLGMTMLLWDNVNAMVIIPLQFYQDREVKEEKMTFGFI